MAQSQSKSAQRRNPRPPQYSNSAKRAGAGGSQRVKPSPFASKPIKKKRFTSYQEMHCARPSQQQMQHQQNEVLQNVQSPQRMANHSPNPYQMQMQSPQQLQQQQQAIAMQRDHGYGHEQHGYPQQMQQQQPPYAMRSPSGNVYPHAQQMMSPDRQQQQHQQFVESQGGSSYDIAAQQQ